MHYKIHSIEQERIEKIIVACGWDKNCPFGLDRFNYIELEHLDFFGNKQEGQIIVLDIVTQNVINIFTELLKKRFPIYSLKPISAFNCDDEESMRNNNSSCFCNRKIMDSSTKSLHSYGVAIDINPVQNPMIKIVNTARHFDNIRIFPGSDNIMNEQNNSFENYINRSNIKKGMVENIIEIFTKNGFHNWGGNWNDPIDFHHFDIGRNLAEKLATSEKNIAQNIWQSHLQNLSKAIL